MPTMKTERSGNASSRCPSLETIQGMSAGDVRWRCGDRDVGTDSEFMTSCASSESVPAFPLHVPKSECQATGRGRVPSELRGHFV